MWGLVRSAQKEHPDRFVLLDLRPQGGSRSGVAGGSRAASRRWPSETAVLVPRLAHVGAGAAERASPWAQTAPLRLDPDGTVLIAGGRADGRPGRRAPGPHLECRASAAGEPPGPDAPGAPELADRLTSLGAQVRVVAADLTDGDAVAALVAGIDPAHPLTGVIHAAG